MERGPPSGVVVVAVFGVRADGSFFRLHCSGQVNRVVFWGDETTGGNPLRPDSRTKFLCLYWSFLELPEWYRALDHGWMPIGYMKYDTLKHIVSGYSGVLKHVCAPLASTADSGNRRPNISTISLNIL